MLMKNHILILIKFTESISKERLSEIEMIFKYFTRFLLSICSCYIEAKDGIPPRFHPTHNKLKFSSILEKTIRLNMFAMISR